MPLGNVLWDPGVSFLKSFWPRQHSNYSVPLTLVNSNLPQVSINLCNLHNNFMRKAPSKLPSWGQDSCDNTHSLILSREKHHPQHKFQWASFQVEPALVPPRQAESQVTGNKLDDYYYHLVDIFLVPRVLYFLYSFLIPTRALEDKYYINLML